MPSKEEIIKKFWPKPQECNILNIPVMREAIGKMMDEWAGYLIGGTTHVTHTYEIPDHLIDELIKQRNNKNQ